MATYKWSLTKHNTLVCDSKEVLSIFRVGNNHNSMPLCLDVVRHRYNEYDFGNTSHLKIEDNFHVYLFYIRVVALEKSQIYYAAPIFIDNTNIQPYKTVFSSR